MRAILFGATGMVGQGVLRECLRDDRVQQVTAVVRRTGGLSHPKLREIIHHDFADYSTLSAELSGFDACFFCLGVSVAGKSEEEYTRITYDYTLAAARALAAANRDMIFCYVSGAGTDSTERGRWMWARVKGKTENDLRKLPFRRVYAFRPGFIQPLDGIRSRTAIYRWIYALTALLVPLLKRLFPGQITTTRNLGKAMIEVCVTLPEQEVLENQDIERIASRSA